MSKFHMKFQKFRLSWKPTINDNGRQHFWVSWSSVMSSLDCLYKLQSPPPNSYSTSCPFLWPWVCHRYRHTYRMGNYLCPIHRMRTEWDLCVNIGKSSAKLLSLICAFPNFTWSFLRTLFQDYGRPSLSSSIPCTPKPSQITIYYLS